jgi:hypothetical protein
MTVLTLVVLLLALVTSCDSPGRTNAPAWNEPDGFRGVPWGASREELRVHLQEAGVDVTCGGKVPDGCASQHLIIGPVHTGAYYAFAPDADKFEQVTLIFDPIKYEALRAIFEERYGKPSEVREERVQNRMSAKFTNETTFWRGKSVTIALGRYGTRVDTGYALFAVKAVHDRENEESQKAFKKGKDDL